MVVAPDVLSPAGAGGCDFVRARQPGKPETSVLAMDIETAQKPRYPDLIYVVEDDPDVSQLIEHNLRTAGYDVSTFFSGAPVVPQATRVRPALFLLDIMLPGIS